MTALAQESRGSQKRGTHRVNYRSTCQRRKRAYRGWGTEQYTPQSSALNPDLNLWNHVIDNRHRESFRNDSTAAIPPIPGEVIRYIRRSSRWCHCGLVVCRGFSTCPSCHRDCRQDNPQHLEPNAPSQGASPLPADAPPLPPVAELKTYEEVCTNPAKVWHKHLNNRILNRLSSAFAGTLRACNVKPKTNAVHQQMLTGPEQRDVDDAAECSPSRRGAKTRKAQGLPPSSLHGGET
jgi:hypothetical protein